MMKQTTIKKIVQCEGIGLHSGQLSKVILKPAPANHGIKFAKKVEDDYHVMSADVQLVKSSERCTVIENDFFRVMTIEHLLSACVGCGVHNLLIEITAEELPILDGSSAPWVELIEQAEIKLHDDEVQFDQILEPLNYTDADTGGIYTFTPSDITEFSVAIDFNSQVVAPQYASWNENEDFKKEIAPCRTFVFLHDVLILLQHGLIKGGTLDSAVLITEQSVDPTHHLLLQQHFPEQNDHVLEKGIHAKGGLYFNNELARHKLLDLVGDISLINRFFKGKIFAVKPSHKGNTAFAKVLKKHIVEQAKSIYYNSNDAPVYTNEEIAKMLPHRYPFLLVDKIIFLDDQKVIGIKNVTFNENFFQGHFPNNPVMPGVLQIEALAQVGGVLAIRHMPVDQKFDTYFLKIDNAKFKRKVIPGDTLLLKMELMEPIRRGICKMQGTALVGNKIVAEAELTAQLVART
jgi:UDP-3-O-[3-hydroxymyristoyl] N-acetylglucosamine deacetylase / 3-hydroxyacyl-[acyl-carrier-protein] dehydratase